MYIYNVYKEYTERIDSKEFTELANICKKIYEEFEDLEPLYQAASGIILEKAAKELKAHLDSCSEMLKPQDSKANILKVKHKNGRQEDLEEPQSKIPRTPSAAKK
jgi:hypothetical protein